MLVVHIHVHVKTECIGEFLQVTLENAHNSIKEPGIVRFDIAQQEEDPSRFVLVEIYRTAADPARHKETAHYARWRESAEKMMAEPRYSVKYHNIFPDDQQLG